MGLGKTIELLACIMSNPYKSLTSDLDQTAEEAANKLDEELKTRKQERIDCPCGAYDKEVYDRIWVQCNCCDVWQHASCVGFGPEFEYVRNFEREISSNGKKSKSCTIIEKPKRVAGRITATMEIQHSVNKDYICGSCSRLIGSVEVPGISGATLIVCPPSILQQWQEEIARYVLMRNARIFMLHLCFHLHHLFHFVKIHGHYFLYLHGYVWH
jgi:E3 ubiquitin-protein ligase SHPRH